MGTSQRGQFPPFLVRGRDRFQAWRRQRTAGGQIPQALCWAMASRLAKAHGVSRTVKRLASCAFPRGRSDTTAVAPETEPLTAGRSLRALSNSA